MNNIFGEPEHSKIPVITSSDIDGANYETRVFARPKKDVVIKNVFFEASVSNQFFSIKREPLSVERPKVSVDILKRNNEERYDPKHVVNQLVNRHVVVGKKKKDQFAKELALLSEQIKKLFIEEVAPISIAYDIALNESKDILKELTGTDINASTDAVNIFFNLGVEVKAFLQFSRMLNLPKEHSEALVKMIMEERIRKPRK